MDPETYPAPESQLTALQHSQTSSVIDRRHAMIGAFRPVTLDHSPQLLEKSHRLRYQAYCLERRFLRAEDYPDQLEFDDYDRDSVHVGVLSADGQLAGTARIVKPNSAGLPALRHCSLFSGETTLADNSNTVVEISRVCINRRYTSRRIEAAASSDLELREYGRRDDVFATLAKAVYHATKRLGATHWLVAIEKPLRRRMARYGLPFQLAGPEVNYYGLVAPYIMNLAQLDQVIVARELPHLMTLPSTSSLGVGHTSTNTTCAFTSAQADGHLPRDWFDGQSAAT